MENKKPAPPAGGQSMPTQFFRGPKELAAASSGQPAPGAPSCRSEEPASASSQSVPAAPSCRPKKSPLSAPGQKESVPQTEFVLHPVGQVKTSGSPALLQIFPAFTPALFGLFEYSHAQVLWWFDGTDTPVNRARTIVRCPYVGAPEKLGVFATRSPFRPNPIALSCARILSIDEENGRVALDAFDAEPGSFVLDLKPYAPSSDRVESPSVPAWSAHWPVSLEASQAFDWERETVSDFHQ